MFGEDLVFAFCCLLSLTERLKEALVIRYGVKDPLSFNWGEERAVSPSSVLLLLKNWQQILRDGRAACRENRQLPWEFDVTMGFPGEDIC